MDGQELYDELNEQKEMDALEAAIEREAAALVQELKYLLPIKTGNLRNNAFRLEKIPGGFQLFIDDVNDIGVGAPYAKYPNLKKKLDKIWPVLVQKFVTLLAASIGGVVE
jgi:hypothetical protein